MRKKWEIIRLMNSKYDKHKGLDNVTDDSITVHISVKKNHKSCQTLRSASRGSHPIPANTYNPKTRIILDRPKTQSTCNCPSIQLLHFGCSCLKTNKMTDVVEIPQIEFNSIQAEGRSHRKPSGTAKIINYGEDDVQLPFEGSISEIKFGSPQSKKECICDSLGLLHFGCKCSYSKRSK